MDIEIKQALERTLQGLAYWMAYKHEKNIINLKEADIVSTAAELLNVRLSNYYIKSEVDYSSLNDSLPKQQADLALFSRNENKCNCIIEFKLGSNTNGGYKQDVQKLEKVKKLVPDINCLVIIAYSKSCTLKVPKILVTPEGKAKRGIIKNVKGANIKVRRVCNALASKSSNKMKKVICLEVI